MALAALAGGGALAGSAGQNQGVREPRTLFTLPDRVRDLAQDGSHLAWVPYTDSSTVEVLDVRRRKRTVIGRFRSDPNTGNTLQIEGFAFAGGRVLIAHVPAGVCSLSGCAYEMWTASLKDRRLREVGARSVYEGEEGNRPTIPVAGDGPTLVYYAYCTGGDDCRQSFHISAIRRVSGRRDFKVIDSVYPTGLAAAHGRVAFAEPTTSRIGRASPAWSPDGSRIAFIRDQQDLTEHAGWSRTEAGAGVYALRGEGGSEARIIPGTVSSIDWSHDGRFVFGRSTETGSEIYVANDDGGGERHVGAGFSPAWSPDASRIAFVRGSDVYVADDAGRSPRRISAGWAPAWAPDGTRLAVARDDGIYVVNADGTAERPLRGVTSQIRDLDWSPDGSRIAYEAIVDDFDNSAIFVMALDGRGARRISPRGVSSTSPRWSADGSRIAFARGDPQADYPLEPTPFQIYAMTPDGGAVRRLTSPSPRTARVSVADAVSGKLVSRFVVAGDVEALALSRSRLAVLVRNRGRRRIEIRDAKNGTLVKNLSVPRSTERPISIAGRALVFRVARTIHRLDVATGRISAIAKAASTPIGLSIETKRVAWAENHRGRARFRAITVGGP